MLYAGVPGQGYPMASLDSWKVRSFQSGDLPACSKLYIEGLLGGTLAENDTALDIDDIDTVYMRYPGNHFWVAESSAGQIVGMVGVQAYEAGTAQIRRLRVANDFRRRGIGSAMVETALQFCEEKQYLKITLDTFLDREPAIRLFEKHRFHHDHTRMVNGKPLMYFYLDLYTGHARQDKSDWHGQHK